MLPLLVRLCAGRQRSHGHAADVDAQRARRSALPRGLPPAAFRSALEREKALTLRSSRSLAVLTLEPGRGRVLGARTQVIVDGLVRTSDIIGWLDEERLAVILPDTDTAGAAVLLARIRATLEGAEHVPAFGLYVYPSEHDARGPYTEPLAATEASHATTEHTDEDALDVEPLRRTGTDDGDSLAGMLGSRWRDEGGIWRDDLRGRLGASVAQRPRPTNHLATGNRRLGSRPVAFGGGDPRTPELSPAGAGRATSSSTRSRRSDSPSALRLVTTGARASLLVPEPRDLLELTCQGVSASRRAVDIVVASVLLVLLSPLFMVVAVLVKCTTPGTVFYVQSRAGLGGRPFRFFKFRSMYRDASARLAELGVRNEKDGPIFKMKKDPRVTPLGRFLRRLSIDELPQIYNVLIGDMTLIGPRPPTLKEFSEYEPWQRERLAVTGGLTCIWQVSGRSDLSFEQWVRMDLDYIRRRSLWLDLSILRRTFWAVLSGRGAY